MINEAKELWSAVNSLRGTIDAADYKNYILGLLFFNILSKKVENADGTENEVIDRIGFFIPEDLLFSSVITKIKRGSPILSDLKKSFGYIERNNYFSGIFDDVDLTSSKLGSTTEEKNTIISNLILAINNINISLDGDKDDLGDIYEYLIYKFASSAGKKGGEFFTPSAVSNLLSNLVNMDNVSKSSIYDPTCGSGALLIRAGTNDSNITYYGQELNRSNYNMTRMNMFIKGVDFKNYFIFHGNTLKNDMVKDYKFDIIVANPPYSAKWNNDAARKDKRFSGQPLAPKSKADYAFIQHMLYHLKEEGRMAVVLPLGVLFRVKEEAEIRNYLLESDYIESVIRLPDNIFYGTKIPTVIMTFNKSKKKSNKKKVLFIDAKDMYIKLGKKNEITSDQVLKITSLYSDFIHGKLSNEEKNSTIVDVEQILSDGGMLNMNLYMNNFSRKSFRKIKEILLDIKEVEGLIVKNNESIKDILENLGLMD